MIGLELMNLGMGSNGDIAWRFMVRCKDDYIGNRGKVCDE